jgi:hypothetical protein
VPCVHPGVDAVAAANICDRSIDELSSCTVTDLMNDGFKGRPALDRVLWVTTIDECFLISGLHLLVMDAGGNAIMLLVYNFAEPGTRFDQLQSIFPINTRLGIKSPYLKVSNSGSIALRIDNPCNLIIEKPAAARPSTSATASSEGDPKELKAKGNAAYMAKDCITACDQYSLALQAAGPDRWPPASRLPPAPYDAVP